MSAIVERAAEVLATHFVMWHDLPHSASTTLPSPPGEWRCACGLKFGFSDSAIAHVAKALADAKLLIAAFPDGHAGTLTGDLLTDMAAYARRLQDRAEAAQEEVVALVRLLAEAINAHRDLHRIYPSTAVCMGGIGGQALTPHCGESCRNSDKHTSENARWESVERAYFRRKDGDPTWADQIDSGAAS